MDINKLIKAYRRIRDARAEFNWMTKTGNADFLERRVRRSSIEEWMEEYDQPPPGIDVFRKS